MKKRMLLCLGWLLCLPALWAQSPLSDIVYPPNRNRDMADLMDLIGVNQLHVELRGSLAGKRAELICFLVRGGRTDSLRLPFHSPLPADSLSLKALSYQFHPDSVKLSVSVSGTPIWSEVLPVHKTDHILLDTPMDDIPANDIPLFAYSTGLPVQMEFDGQVMAATSYCKLRDQHLHPSRWAGRLELPDYAYFVLRFTE